MYRVTVEPFGESEERVKRINGDYEEILFVGVKTPNEDGQAETNGYAYGEGDTLVEALAADGQMARLCLRAALRRFRRWLLNDLPEQVSGQ